MFRKSLLSILCFWVLIVGMNGQLSASHIRGVSITYECINPCTTRVHRRELQRCGYAATIVNAVLQWHSTPAGCAEPLSLGPWSGQTLVEVTPVCPSQPTDCTVPGAPAQGYREYYGYMDYDVCAVPPCEFRIIYGTCCRPSPISGGTLGVGLEINDTRINTGLPSCNNSPEFRSLPPLYVISGQPARYDLGAYDIDGDSLVHSISTCYTNNNTSIVYPAGHSYTSPLGPNWTITMDPATGMTDFVATVPNFAMGPMCMKVDEYRNGQWIGSIQREFEVFGVNYNVNQSPSLTAPSNVSPNVTVNGFHLRVCGVGSVCFDLGSTDPDPGQNLLLTWDGRLPGATFSQVGAPSVFDSIAGTSAAPPIGRFCWTPPGPGNYVVHFKVLDDGCQVRGMRYESVMIEVESGATATATPAACPTVNFSANPCVSASYSYTWSGDAGFSSTQQNPTYTYPGAGDYAWQLVVAGAGVQDTLRDTVHVSGAPVYLPSLFAPDTVHLGPCLGATSAFLSYQGGFASYLSSTSATTSSFLVNQAGTYYGDAYDAAGCGATDTVVVTWTDADIAGIVQTSLSTPLVGQKIYLIRYDSVAQTLYAADSAFTDGTGTYFFCGVQDSVVFLKAAPDSAAYPLELPTYADTALFWSQAIAFHPFASLPIFHNFVTRPGANPGGPGFIGGLISQGANKVAAVGDPVPGLTLVIRNAMSGAVYGVTRTDAHGYFSFGGLPLGDYRLIPDKPGVSIVQVPQLSLTALVPSLDSLDFRHNSTFLERYVPSSVQPGPPSAVWTVSPNPFSREVRLQVDLESPNTVEWRVLDVLGKVADPGMPTQAYPAGHHTWQLAQDLAPGIYFVELNIDGQTSLKKILKAR